MRPGTIMATAIAASAILAGCTENGERLTQIINPAPLEGPGGSTSASEMRIEGSDNSTVSVKENLTYQAMLDNLATVSDNESSTIDSVHDAALKYLKTGLALSDELCSDWFRQLGRAQAEAGAARDNLSNVGALAATILGLTSAGSAITGGVAGGLGFAENVIKSEVANFIVAPDVSEVQRLVELNRIEQARKILTETAKYDYPTARMTLIQYDNSCSHLAIKRIVNKSVGTQTTSKEQALGGRALDNLAASLQVADLGDHFDKAVQPLSTDDAFNLYLSLMPPPGIARSVTEGAREALKERAIIKADGALNLIAADREPRVRQILLLIGTNLRYADAATALNAQVEQTAKSEEAKQAKSKQSAIAVQDARDRVAELETKSESLRVQIVTKAGEIEASKTRMAQAELDESVAREDITRLGSPDDETPDAVALSDAQSRRDRAINRKNDEKITVAKIQGELSALQKQLEDLRTGDLAAAQQVLEEALTENARTKAEVDDDIGVAATSGGDGAPSVRSANVPSAPQDYFPVTSEVVAVP